VRSKTEPIIRRWRYRGEVEDRTEVDPAEEPNEVEDRVRYTKKKINRKNGLPWFGGCCSEGVTDAVGSGNNRTKRPEGEAESRTEGFSTLDRG